MALDPAISLDVGRGVTQPEDFLTAGTQAAALGNATAVAMQRVQQAKDMAAINAAFTQAQGDPDKTQDLLNQSGSATAAATWQQNVNAQRKQMADQHDQALKSTEAGFGIASQVANTLDSTSTPEQYAAAKLAIGGVMGQQGKPVLDAVMPDNPNPSDIPGIVSKVQGLSQTAKEHVDAARQAVQDFSDGKTQSAVARSLAMINTGDPAQDLAQRGAMLNTLHERYGSTIDPILQSFVPLIKQGAAPGDILSAGGIKPTETIVPKGSTVLQTPAGGGAPTPVFTAAPGPPTNEAELAMDAANASSPTSKQSQAALARLQAMHPPAAAVTVQMSDPAVDQAAQKYLDTGQLPGGFGAAAIARNNAIMNRAAQMSPGARLAANSAEYKANSATLTPLTKSLSNLTAFENTANANLKQFTDLAAQIPDTGIPWLNTPVRSLSQNVVGSTLMPAVNAARQVALTEISRIVSNPNLTGQLSDSARSEVMGLSPENATIPQIKRVVGVLQQDMANRRTSMAAQVSDIQNRLGIAPGQSTGATTPAPAPSATLPPPAAGMVRVRSKEGTIVDIPKANLATAQQRGATLLSAGAAGGG